MSGFWEEMRKLGKDLRIAFPGGILQSTAIGELTEAELTDRIEVLLRESRERAGRLH